MPSSPGCICLAVTWWIGGESSPIAWWAAIAYLVQFPAVPFVLTILHAIVVRPS